MQPMVRNLAAVLLLAGAGNCPAQIAEYAARNPQGSGATVAPAEPDTLRLPELPGEQAVVSYAGGAVQFPLPEAWQVSELAVGREIRLVLSPGEVPQRLADLTDGLWMSYRSRPDSERLSAEALRRELTERRDRCTTGRILNQSEALETLNGHPARRQNFRVSHQASNRPDDAQELRGSHILAQTPRGIFDIHLLAPAERFDDRLATLDQLLKQIRLGDPPAAAAKVSEHVASATGAIGAWKAITSRLLLLPDGRAVAHFDSRRSLALDAQGYYDYRRRQKQLTGRFSAELDLLRITWDDGSRLNYRWRVDDGQLYLTDHHGRVFQLERYFP